MELTDDMKSSCLFPSQRIDFAAISIGKISGDASLRRFRHSSEGKRKYSEGREPENVESGYSHTQFVHYLH